jgi:hypothetical protein
VESVFKLYLLRVGDASLKEAASRLPAAEVLDFWTSKHVRTVY